MKKNLLAFSAIVAMVTVVNAGKNVELPPSEPLPIPPAITAVPLGLYLGGGFTYSKAECQCAPGAAKLSNGEDASTLGKVDSTTYGVNLKLGYDFNEFIGLEAKYIYTPWKDKDKTLKHYGIYLKPSYPVTENFDVYALLGYGKTECETLKDSQKGFAWGVGASYSFDKRVEGKKDGLGVYVEYLRPLKKTGNKDITIDMVNAGVQYNW